MSGTGPTGSATAYGKAGQHTRVADKGDNKPTGAERLSSRMLYCTTGEVSPEQRATGNYALNPRQAKYDPSPKMKVDRKKAKVTTEGLASRGNVIHTRYLKGAL